MNAPGETLPSYTQDVSPPLYAVDSDEEDSDYVPSYYNYFSSSARLGRGSSIDNDRGVELGSIDDDSIGERERFLRRTDTGRIDRYSMPRSTTPRRSVQVPVVKNLLKSTTPHEVHEAGTAPGHPLPASLLQTTTCHKLWQRVWHRRGYQ